MRFRFCGDLDCPDWILAEINTLARMSSIKMKLLCQVVVRQILGTSSEFEKIKKLTMDAKFELSDMKAAVAALTFIMTLSAQHGVDDEVLNSELQQLGLPREHSLALCRVYSEQLAPLMEYSRANSLRLSTLKTVSCGAQFVGGSSLNSSGIQEAVLLVEEGCGKAHQLQMTELQLGLLISECMNLVPSNGQIDPHPYAGSSGEHMTKNGLKKAQEIMETL